MSKLAPLPPINHPGKTLVSFEEFLKRDGDTHVEWVNGEVVTMSAVQYPHDALSMFLGCVIKALVDIRKLGVVCHEPFQMKAGPDLPSRSPDLFFVANNHRKRLKLQYLDGPADMVIEVISPESGSRDRGEKYYEYEQGRVREYWLLDPYRRVAELYARNRTGIYRPMAVDADGTFHSTVVPGLSVPIEWLWQNPLPSVGDLFKMWELF